MFSLPVRFLFALLMGAILGLERESSRHDDIPTQDQDSSAGGIRTYALVSLLGAFAGFFYVNGLSSLFLLLTGFVGLIVLIYYALGSYLTKHLGMTNEISIFITFVLGFFSMSGVLPLEVVVVLLVITLLVLSLKSQTKKLMNGISGKEVQSFISYALIALVILPLLPNTPITLSHLPYISTFLSGYGVDLGQFANLEIFNPRKIWFIVALVTGIDVFGYILGKFVGSKKSFTLTSFVGGFISSTSTTQSLAQKSVRGIMINSLVGAALLANMASFFQIFLLVGPINSKWLISITPTLLAIIFASGALAVYFLSRSERKGRQEKSEAKEQKEEKKIFALLPAVKFAGVLIAVKIITKICLILFGNSGFIISSVIASFAGIDAIVLNLADLAGKTISFQTALFTFILVNATNLGAKTLYTFLQGHRSFAVKFLLSVVGIVALSFVGFLFL